VNKPRFYESEKKTGGEKVKVCYDAERIQTARAIRGFE